MTLKAILGSHATDQSLKLAADRRATISCYATFDGRPGQLLGDNQLAQMTARKANTSDQREDTRIALAVGIEVPRPGSHEVTVFGRRLCSSVAFDYRIQFLSDGSVRFIFRAAPSRKVWRLVRYMGFQPEGRGNQIWVRKSGSLWSAKELVDTINFVHLVIHHGYVIPDQRF